MATLCNLEKSISPKIVIIGINFTVICLPSDYTIYLNIYQSHRKRPIWSIL